MCTEEAFCDSIKRRMEDRLTGRLFSHGEYTEERRGTTLKSTNPKTMKTVTVKMTTAIVTIMAAIAMMMNKRI